MNPRIPSLVLALALAVPLGAQEGEPPVERIYHAAEITALPRALNPADFETALVGGYPPELRAEGVEGTVSVAFVVAADGTVRDLAVTSSSHPGFDEASLAAVAVLRFDPACADGRPVPVRLEIPIRWELRAEPGAGEDGAEDPPSDDRDSVFELAEVDVQPRVRNSDQFARALAERYPPALRDAALGGTVIVRFRIDRQGYVQQPRVLSSTQVAFDRPTLAAVRRLRFHPAVKDGRPVPVWITQPVTWTVAR